MKEGSASPETGGAARGTGRAEEAGSEGKQEDGGGRSAMTTATGPRAREDARHGQRLRRGEEDALKWLTEPKRAVATGGTEPRRDTISLQLCPGQTRRRERHSGGRVGDTYISAWLSKGKNAMYCSKLALCTQVHPLNRQPEASEPGFPGATPTSSVHRSPGGN